ncbi:hypothetical protein F5144DRAFT_289957 [Chaetomium tenue]|uniref:Uncharacterized protein n=1 Tax=Chaetomium tenue TaxID=1854479 RepID=A0ACB7P287_9PEZI|nr:hypothetical protein F5144DRAFT_289957 [Chaetomium globosum]
MSVGLERSAALVFLVLPCFLSLTPTPTHHTTHRLCFVDLPKPTYRPKQLPLFCTYVFQPLTITNYLVILHVTILETWIVCSLLI